MSMPLVNYPFSQFQGVLSDTQPFSYRDGRTFAQVLEALKTFVLQFEAILNEQGEAINAQVENVNETIADLLSKIIQFTITRVPPGDVYEARMGDGSEFAAYTKEGTDHAISHLQEVLTSALATSQESQNTEIAADIEAVDTAIKALIAQLRRDHDNAQANQSGVNTSTAQNIVTINAALDALRAADQQMAQNWQNSDTAINARIDSLAATSGLFVNVRHHGAKGDGVTDDTDAIRSAAKAAGTGGRVWFPKGKYRTTDTVDVLIQQRWEGEDSAMDMAEVFCGIIYEGNGIAVRAANSTICNLRIEGRGPNVAGTIGIYSEASGLKLRDVAVRKFATGISIKEVWYAYLDNVFLMRNDLALLVTYCYNVSCYNLRIHAARGDGLLGRGIELQNRSMLSMHGGSIEQYVTGVLCTTDTVFYASGVYWETGPSNQSTKYGINAAGMYSVVTTIANQVYVANHTAWLAVTTNSSADRITAIGNRFKASAAGDGNAAYSWLNGHRSTLSLTLIGDNWREPGVRGGYVYRANTSIPVSSIILDPVGSPAEMLYGGGAGRLMLGSGLSVADGEGARGNVRVGIVAADPANDASQFAQGALLFNVTRQKLICFTLSGWQDMN